jgi:hypothetical protein
LVVDIDDGVVSAGILPEARRGIKEFEAWRSKGVLE